MTKYLKFVLGIVRYDFKFSFDMIIIFGYSFSYAK